MTLINTTDRLADFCQSLAGATFITVDTEFMRERTYWPKVCLIQVAGPKSAAAIDPIGTDIDLAPLCAVLIDPSVVKVFHAGRQDMEIFYHLMKQLPAPVFDTQLAAMVCGFGDQVSYETLVSKLARAKLDKASRFTDWSLRPLSSRQVDYALADVTYLRVVYEKLHARLQQTKRADWLDEELASLTSINSYDIDPRRSYLRIKTRSHSKRFLAILRELAAWREIEAQERNVPRNWVMRDEALVEIAHHEPATFDDLARTRGLARRSLDGGVGDALLAAVKRGMAMSDADSPDPTAKFEAPRSAGPVSSLLKVLLSMKCDEFNVAQKLVASFEDVERIAAEGEAAKVPALSGWRREIFGEDALRLRRGDFALAVNDHKLVLVKKTD